VKLENKEYDNFNAGMENLLNANPAVVKAAMEQEKKARKAERKTKRSASSSAPASSNRDA
jgi:hypothetical protein